MLTESPSAIALRQAIEFIGSQRKLAQLLGITQQSISAWVLKGQTLPAEHVLKVEAATGIPRHALRPDIYPPHEYAPSPPPAHPNTPGGAAPAQFSRPGGDAPSAAVVTATPAAAGVDASRQGESA